MDINIITGANKVVTVNNYFEVYLSMSEYRLHWTKYCVDKARKSGNEKSVYRSLNMQQRGSIFNYLNSIAYDYPEDNPPRMDRTKFYIKSMVNNWVIYRKKSSC